MPDESGTDWVGLAVEMNDAAKPVPQAGGPFSIEQLQSVDFCVKVIARLGYSVAFTFNPVDMVNVSRIRRGIGPLTPEQVKEMEPGFYTYQLLGGRITQRGAHESPSAGDIQAIAIVALFNVLRLCAKYGVPSWSAIERPT